MAINQNHTFDDLDGIKCAIVEKNVAQQRVDFLKELLTFNGFTVVVVPTPPAKGAPALAEGEVAPPPTSWTVGVTDSTFNAINAVFGRLLKTKDGKVVTMAYWQQKESVSHDEIPYFAKKWA